MNSNNMLVSVVVLTYNDANFIEKTLDSIKEQTYRNVELVISDDCSTDDTVERCSSWIKQNNARFSNVQLLTVEENTGITYNITRAEKAAKGEWIKSIGGDDLLAPNCIEKFMSFITQNPNVKIVQCGLIKINEDDDVIGHGVKGPNKYFHSDKISAYWQHQFLLRKDPIDALGLFKSKKLLEDLNYYDCDFPMQEDVAFAMKVVSSDYKIWWINHYLVKRRMRAGSLSGLNDTFLVHKNDIIRAAVNKKYFVPQLGWLEGRLLIYKDYINRLFYTHVKLNRKSSIVCKMLRVVLQCPYIAIRTIKLKCIMRNL